MPMVPRHRFGIEDTLLPGAQLDVERLDRPGALRHPGTAHVRYRLHAVEALRRAQLFEFVTHRLAVHAGVARSGLGGFGEGVPRRFLFGGQRKLFLQFGQMCSPPVFASSSALLLLARLAARLVGRVVCRHRVSRRRQNAAARDQASQHGTFRERTLLRFHCDLLSRRCLNSRPETGTACSAFWRSDLTRGCLAGREVLRTVSGSRETASEWGAAG